MPRVIQREYLDAAVLSRLSRLTLEARVPVAGGVSGIHRSATRGSSVEFAEYRKYVPGDDVKHVDWRVYARSDRFYMKEFEADTNLRCHLVFDVSHSMQFAARHGRKFDYARRLAATLAYLLIHQGDAVGLHGFSDRVVADIPPRRAPAHLRAIFEALDRFKPAGPTELVGTLHRLAEKIRRRSLVIVFSDFFTDVAPLLDSFQHLKFHKHDIAVFHLLDRRELDFDFDRPVRFGDLESDFHLVTEPAVIAAGYQRELQEYLQDLQRGCREFGVDYRRVVTDENYETVLAGFLLQRLNARAGRPGGRA